MRVVLDTNVVVSAFLWKGPPNEILSPLVRRNFQLFSSKPLILELTDVLRRKKLEYRLKETGYTPEKILVKYLGLIKMVVPVEFLEPPPIRDEDDVAVLAAAFSARASFIVTGDNELLELKHFDTINILTPLEFVKICLHHIR